MQIKTDKTLCMYLATSIVALLFSGIYIYIEECYFDESFAMLPLIEQQLYVKYCTNPLSFNPFDNYYSVLENYIINLCWIVGCWNLFDFLLGLGILQDKNINPNYGLKRKTIYSIGYNKLLSKLKVTKLVTIKEKRKLWQNQKQNQK